MLACITGGSGFIGAHLARALSGENETVIIDKNKAQNDARFVQADLKRQFDPEILKCDVLFHFAASPDVKNSMTNPMESIENNIIATQNVLEACRTQDIEKIIFASTSAVYGNARAIPTPEEAELKPVSVYGATKVACEALIRSYHETYGIHAVIMRYANIYGPGSKHGVMHDFIKKLIADSSCLEVLGNGQQLKSYLYIDDAIRATLIASKRNGWNVFNAGSKTQASVIQIAEMIINKMDLGSVKIKFLGGETGWPGDVPRFLLDVRKMESLGWKEETDIKTGIGKYLDWVVKQ